MNDAKLFWVLVAGGALLAAGCREEGTPTDAGLDAPGAVDGGLSDAATTAPDAELENCGICPNTECCVTEADGSAHERDGMLCCWGTSC